MIWLNGLIRMGPFAATAGLILHGIGHPRMDAYHVAMFIVLYMGCTFGWQRSED